MKRKLLALLLAGIMASALLTGCGGGQSGAQTTAQSSAGAQSSESPVAEASAAAESAAAASVAEESAAAASSTVESTAAASGQEKETGAPASPYAWLGLQDMPACPYLDALCTYHYYREYTNYVLSYKQENIEAVDGLNSFKKTDNNRTYSVDGHVISFSDSSKNYYEQDIGDALFDYAKENYEKSKADGSNMIGREFVTTGTGVIPVYCDTEGDQTEYEYYEYDYPATLEASGYQMIERFYMKDGDVYAVYQQMSKDDEQVTASAEIIHSMSGEIPDGTFDIPSTDGYEKLKLGDN